MGACPEDQAIRTVHASLDAGITFINTAEAYFTSETVLGKALRGHRHEVFLATKLSGEHTSQHIAEAIENSLRENWVRTTSICTKSIVRDPNTRSRTRWLTC